MKKIAIVGLVIIAIFACGLLLWQQAKQSKDRDSRRKLVGTWSWEFFNERGTNTIAPDGSYDEQLVSTNSKSVKMFQMTAEHAHECLESKVHKLFA